MSSLLQPYRACRALRSADQRLLSVPRTKTKRFGDKSFRQVAPGLWKALPINVSVAESVTSFKRLLKTHFSAHRIRILVTDGVTVLL
jgi:hypothetical protein